MKYRVLMSVVVVALMLIPLACQHEKPPQDQEIPPQNWTVANETEFLAKCEHSDLEFERLEVQDTLFYGHQRMIGDAIVQNDSIRYWFDKDTGNFEKKLVHWRDDLPDKLPPVISKEAAESIGGGCCGYLLYIDPDYSISHTITPTPNPCWAVYVFGSEDYDIDVVVVDAVTGEIIGQGDIELILLGDRTL